MMLLNWFQSATKLLFILVYSFLVFKLGFVLYCFQVLCYKELPQNFIWYLKIMFPWRVNPLPFVCPIKFLHSFPFLTFIYLFSSSVITYMHFDVGRSEDFPLPVCIDGEFLLVASVSYPNMFSWACLKAGY